MNASAMWSLLTTGLVLPHHSSTSELPHCLVLALMQNLLAERLVEHEGCQYCFPWLSLPVQPIRGHADGAG